MIETVNYKGFDNPDVSVEILRDDLLHPYVSGNKWRKLMPNIRLAKELNAPGIITWGGAFSNHIAATAAACNEAGLKSTGIIRGEESDGNPTLDFARTMGMNLKFISRSDYRNQTRESRKSGKYINEDGFLIVPEGGANQAGMQGCSAITEGRKQYDYFAVAAGTGTTAAGMSMGLSVHQKVLAFPVLKHPGLMNEVMEDFPDLAGLLSSVVVCNGYENGGYARVTDELTAFVMDFYKETGIPLDLVYTGKMMLGLLKVISSGQIPAGSRILAIHTGGLQGNAGMIARGLIRDVPGQQ